MFTHYPDKGLIQTHLQWQAVKLGSSSGLLWHVSLWNFTYISQDSQEVHSAVSKIFFWVGGGLHLSWFIQQDSREMKKHGVTINWDWCTKRARIKLMMTQTLVRSLKHFKPYQIMYIYRACIENASQMSLSNYTSLLLNSALFNTVAVMPPI